MTTTDHKTCRDCGAEFKRSAMDKTVRCPACRERRYRPALKMTRTEVLMVEAKAAAYRARREGDAEAEAKHTADFLHLRRALEER